jgi:tetratricopeptide (TPR) repeat protein
MFEFVSKTKLRWKRRRLARQKKQKTKEPRTQPTESMNDVPSLPENLSKSHNNSIPLPSCLSSISSLYLEESPTTFTPYKRAKIPSVAEHFWDNKVLPKLMDKDGQPNARPATYVAKTMFQVVWKNQGMLQAKQEVERALLDADEAPNTQNNDGVSPSDNNSYRAQNHFDEGCHLWQYKEYDQALAELLKALRLQQLAASKLTDPLKLKESNVALAKILYSLGAVHLSKRDLKQALQQFRRSLRLFCLSLGRKDVLSKSAAFMMGDVLTAIQRDQVHKEGDEEKKQEENDDTTPKSGDKTNKSADTTSTTVNTDEDDSIDSLDKMSIPWYLKNENNKSPQRSLEQVIASDDTRQIIKRYLRSVFKSIDYERKGDAVLKADSTDTHKAMMEYTLAIQHGPEGDHPDAAILYEKIARLFASQYQWKKASDEYGDALTIYTDTLGSDDMDTVACLNRFLQARGRARRWKQQELIPREDTEAIA